METNDLTFKLHKGGSNQITKEQELAPERCLCNDVTWPWEYNPYNVGLWIIGHEFGPICAVWAGGAQDAFDAAVDGDMLDCLMLEEDDEALHKGDEGEDDDETVTRLGNASEPFDLTYAWISQVNTEKLGQREIALFAEARGNGTVDHLGEL